MRPDSDPETSEASIGRDRDFLVIVKRLWVSGDNDR